MTRLPNVRPKAMVKALLRAGFVREKQIGSHLYLWHPTKKCRTGVPMHPGDLDRSLMKKILKQAQITEAEFRELL